MCVVSMVGEYYEDKWGKWGKWGTVELNPYYPSPTQEEFDKLRKEVEDMKELLKRAKKYDEENGQKDCEMDEKIEFLKKVAELVGVDLEDVFGNNKTGNTS